MRGESPRPQLRSHGIATTPGSDGWHRPRTRSTGMSDPRPRSRHIRHCQRRCWTATGPRPGSGAVQSRLDLNLGGAHVGKTEAVRPPGRLRHDLVCHQAFEHATGVRRHKGEVRAGVDVVPFPDVELLARLRIGVGLPGAGWRPLSLPGEVGTCALAVGIRSRWCKCPPAAPPYVARHLVHPHAYVGGYTRIAVQSAVVVVV